MTIIESMTRRRFQWGRTYYIVRVWRNEDQVKDQYPNEDIGLLVDKLTIWTPPTTFPPLSAILESLVALGRVNAVEIVDENGDGVLLYPDWP